MKAKQTSWFGVASLAVLIGCAGEEQPGPEHPSEEAEVAQASTTEQERKVDPAADELLRRMSDHLAGLQTFTVVADHTVEVVLDSGQKIEYAGKSDVSVQRPNKLRSDRRGEVVDVSFVYDGKTVSIHGKRKNLYAQAPAPATIDETIDFARDKLDLDAPAADLIYSKPYDILMEDVVSGAIVGDAVIGGIPCKHLAFRGNKVDWQLWVQDGEQPLPLKYVITTKDMPSQPEYSVTLHDWNASPRLPDDLFTFSPPSGAERIEFLGMVAPRK